MESVHQQVKLVANIIQPIWTAHSKHAADLRGADNAQAWYLAQAKGAYTQPLVETLDLLRNAAFLDWIGLDTSFKTLPDVATTLSPDIQRQDELATRTMELALHICKNRCQSMAWHDRGWPGALALFSSEDEDDREKGWRHLQRTWATHKPLT